MPRVNAKEAAVISDVDVYPVENLQQLADHLLGIQPITVADKEKLDFSVEDNFEFDFADIRGQESAKRAMEIAASKNFPPKMSRKFAKLTRKQRPYYTKQFQQSSQNHRRFGRM